MTSHDKAERPHTSKLALLAIVGVAVWIVIGSWVTTQWLGSKFHYQEALGQRGLFGLYGPFDWFEWVGKFYRSQRSIFGQGWYIFGGFVASGFITFSFILAFGIRSIKVHKSLHGTANWADEKELRKSGLLPSKPRRGEKLPPRQGVYCGAFEDDQKRRSYLRHDGPEHVAIVAPTRSGKGVSIVVPTLLSWAESCVIHDQKGELWAMTAGWRKEKAKNVCLKFDPANLNDSCGFNPLEEVRLGTEYEVADVQNLVTMIVDPDGKGLQDHWAKTSHALLAGLALHELYSKAEKGEVASLADIATALSDPTQASDFGLFKTMQAATHIIKRNSAGEPVLDEDGKPVRICHPLVAAAAQDMINRAEQERSSVLSTAISFLTLYRDPIVARNVKRSDFRITDLMNADQPVSLFLVVRPEDKDRLKPLIRLLLNQIVRVLLRPELEYVDGRQKPPHKHRLLMMIDEFPSLGKLDVFQEALAYIAGYGMKAMLIMQDISQLHDAYGRDESIISNCHVRIAFAPNKFETARWLSDSCGVTTVVTEKITTSGSRFGGFLGSTSRSYEATSRPLITPDEAMRLKAPEKDRNGQIEAAGEVVVMVAGHSPVRGLQSLYFIDPVFSERVRIAPPSKSDAIPQPKWTSPHSSGFKIEVTDVDGAGSEGDAKLMTAASKVVAEPAVAQRGYKSFSL